MLVSVSDVLLLSPLPSLFPVLVSSRASCFTSAGTNPSLLPSPHAVYAIRGWAGVHLRWGGGFLGHCREPGWRSVEAAGRLSWLARQEQPEMCGAHTVKGISCEAPGPKFLAAA